MTFWDSRRWVLATLWKRLNSSLADSPQQSSSESQIRKHYKKLSLIEHPDKRRPDPSKNETLESVNDHWVELVKAFKTLTDEDIRNNYIQYGHPDGKQSFSIGIALPQFIVQEGNGKYILLLYGMLLGVLLPLFVGRWWYGTQSKTRDGILVDSASNLFTEYKDDMNENAVIGALSSGVEFEDILQDKKGDDNSTKLEARIMKADDACKRLSKSDRERLLNMDDEKRRMALGLLWAYLHRVELNDPILDERESGLSECVEPLTNAYQRNTKSPPSPSGLTNRSKPCLWLMAMWRRCLHHTTLRNILFKRFHLLRRLSNNSHSSHRPLFVLLNRDLLLPLTRPVPSRRSCLSQTLGVGALSKPLTYYRQANTTLLCLSLRNCPWRILKALSSKWLEKDA